MTLTIRFGTIEPETEINWYRDIMDFPKLLNYKNKKWEWVAYNPITGTDYELIFSEIPIHDPSYNEYMPNFEDLFVMTTKPCACGAKFSSFKFDHMRFCPKWTPW